MTPSKSYHLPASSTTTGHGKGEEEIGEGKDVNKDVVEEFEGAEHDSAAEKRVVRKLDWRIVTLLVVLCPFPPFRSLPLRLSTKLKYRLPDLLASLDRSNIGYEERCEIF